MTSKPQLFNRLGASVAAAARWLLSLFQILYVIRYPLLAFGFLIGLMPLVFYGGLRSLLGGLFDLGGANMFWLALFAFTLAATALITLKLILIYGAERFNFDGATADALENNCLVQFVLSKYSIFAAFALCFSLFAGTLVLDCSASDSNCPASLANAENGRRIIGILAAFLVTMFLLFAADLVQRLFNAPEQAAQLPHFLFPFDNIAARWANKWRFPAGLLPRILNRVPRLAALIPVYHARGYFLKDEKSGNVHLLPGHLMAIVLSLVYFGFYFVFGYFWRVCPGDIGKEETIWKVPAIVYAVLIVTVLCWLLPAMSFFFDRYRIPPLLILASIIGCVSFISRNDDYYALKSTPEGDLPIPAAVFSVQNPQQSEDFTIVVAADGGGIQAAAWTARVLTGLEKACHKKFGENFHGCANRIRLISSVSGGSVGAMYFVNAYKENVGLTATDAELDGVVGQAESSSLSNVAWGMAYPDLLRSFVPLPRSLTRNFTSGRGEALEEAWVRQSWAPGSRLEDCALFKPLSSWRKGVREGWRPATIFNATITETGEPLLLGTTDVCKANNRLQQNPQDQQIRTHECDEARDANGFNEGRWNYYDFNRCTQSEQSKHDVSIATAARLSATFPFVTPAPRADADPKTNYRNAFHIVDGGYYDNFGIYNLTEWLNEAIRPDSVGAFCPNNSPPSAQPPPKNVLIVQIRANTLSPPPREASSGWYYQVAAPLMAIYNARVAGQFSRNDFELKQFLANLEKPDSDSNAPTLKVRQPIIFQYKNPDPKKSSPLSWHLTDSEKRDIETSWHNILCPAESSSNGQNDWLQFARFVNEFKNGQKLTEQALKFTAEECESFKQSRLGNSNGL